MAPDQGERRAQLVGDVSQQLSASPERFFSPRLLNLEGGDRGLETLGHVVEMLAKLADLVRAARCHPAGQVAVSQTIGRCAQPLQAAAEAASQQVGRQTGEQ
jgi:hypothetical protein